MLRNEYVDDAMILTRKIGHPELVFNEAVYAQNQELSLVNADQKWAYHCSRRGDDCYVCQRHRYVQMFFQAGRANHEY